MFRKFVIYSLLLLFSTNGLVLELMKLPSLIAHYDKHKNQDNRLTFSSFLSMHYFGTDADDSDNKDEEKLPFKKQSVNLGGNVDALIQEHLQPSFVELNFPIDQQPILFEPQVYHLIISKGLLRPPIS